MRGHEPLVAMRLRGRRPSLAWFDVGVMPHRDWADWPTWTDSARIEVPPADVIRRLDLRFVVGMPVAITGMDDDRVRELFDAARKAGAARVLAFGDAFVADSAMEASWQA